MILDRLNQAARYHQTHPGFAAAFAALAKPGLAELPSGKHVLDGDRLYLMVNRDPGRGQGGAKLEAHRNYIDIQLTLAGQEVIGWKSLDECRDCSEPYTAERDVAFWADRPESWFAVPPGKFAVFFPADVHAPLGGDGDLLKIVVKVAVDW